VTPTYWANALYSNHAGSSRLSTQVLSPVFDTTLEGKGVPWLDVVTSRSTDGKRIYIKAVNTNPGAALRTSITVKGVAGLRPQAEIETLTAASLSAFNSFTTPDAVGVRSHSITAGPSFTVELPKHSITVITLNVN